jgi:hypothetical protein
MLTGSACMFVSTHPDHDPGIPHDALSDHLFQQNTVLVVTNNLSSNRDAMLDVAKTFVRTVAVPWIHDWETRAVRSNYLSTSESSFLVISYCSIIT